MLGQSHKLLINKIDLQQKLLFVQKNVRSLKNTPQLSTNQIPTHPHFKLFQILIHSALHALLLCSIIIITLLTEFWFRTHENIMDDIIIAIVMHPH